MSLALATSSAPQPITFNPYIITMVDLPRELTLTHGETVVFEHEGTNYGTSNGYCYAAVQFTLFYETIFVNQSMFTRDAYGTWTSVRERKITLPTNYDGEPLDWVDVSVMIHSTKPNQIQSVPES